MSWRCWDSGNAWTGSAIRRPRKTASLACGGHLAVHIAIRYPFMWCFQNIRLRPTSVARMAPAATGFRNDLIGDFTMDAKSEPKTARLTVGNKTYDFPILSGTVG